MNATLEKKALDLLGLPTTSRAFLAEKLLASLEDDEPSEEVERAWKKEASRRYKALKAGKAKAQPDAEVMRRGNQMSDCIKHRGAKAARVPFISTGLQPGDYDDSAIRAALAAFRPAVKAAEAARFSRLHRYTALKLDANESKLAESG